MDRAGPRGHLVAGDVAAVVVDHVHVAVVRHDEGAAGVDRGLAPGHGLDLDEVAVDIHDGGAEGHGRGVAVGQLAGQVVVAGHARVARGADTCVGRHRGRGGGLRGGRGGQGRGRGLRRAVGRAGAVPVDGAGDGGLEAGGGGVDLDLAVLGGGLAAGGDQLVAGGLVDHGGGEEIALTLRDRDGAVGVVDAGAQRLAAELDATGAHHNDEQGDERQAEQVAVAGHGFSPTGGCGGASSASPFG